VVFKCDMAMRVKATVTFTCFRDTRACQCLSSLPGVLREKAHRTNRSSHETCHWLTRMSWGLGALTWPPYSMIDATFCLNLELGPADYCDDWCRMTHEPSHVFVVSLLFALYSLPCVPCFFDPVIRDSAREQTCQKYRSHIGGPKALATGELYGMCSTWRANTSSAAGELGQRNNLIRSYC